MNENDDSEKLSLTETSEREIWLNDEKEGALDYLEVKWDTEVDKLTDAPIAAPSPGPGYTVERNLQREYELQKTLHLLAVERTHAHYDYERRELRDSGTTPTAEFNQSSVTKVEVTTEASITPTFGDNTQPKSDGVLGNVEDNTIPQEHTQDCSRSR